MRKEKVYFACTVCARCCKDVSGHRRKILVLPGEAEEISRATGKPIESFARKSRISGPYKFKMKKIRGSCVFLKEDGYCKIYDKRPIVCKFFPFELKADGTFGFARECEGLSVGTKIFDEQKRIGVGYLSALESAAKARFLAEERKILEKSARGKGQKKKAPARFS